jgi:hypothetical protein
MGLPILASSELLLQQPLRQIGDKNTRFTSRIIGSGPVLPMIRGWCFRDSWNP